MQFILYIHGMNVVIIGTGNIAGILGRKIKAAGHDILQVIGRNAEKAYALADLLDAGSNNYYAAIRPDADIYIIAVSDDAIPEIAVQLFLRTGIVVHTAGAVSKNILEKAGNAFGVLYPLQSIALEKEEIPEIPFLVDGNSDQTISTIRKFALTMSHKVQYANDEMRMKMHVAAVITNNFTNHLYTLTNDFCKKEGMDFSMLLPLLTETVHRLQYKAPDLLQTGPAKRNDSITIQKHIAALAAYPELHQLYKEFSTLIIEYYKRHG